MNAPANKGKSKVFHVDVKTGFWICADCPSEERPLQNWDSMRLKIAEHFLKQHRRKFDSSRLEVAFCSGRYPRRTGSVNHLKKFLDTSRSFNVEEYFDFVDNWNKRRAEGASKSQEMMVTPTEKIETRRRRANSESDVEALSAKISDAQNGTLASLKSMLEGGTWVDNFPSLLPVTTNRYFQSELPYLIWNIVSTLDKDRQQAAIGMMQATESSPEIRRAIANILPILSVLLDAKIHSALQHIRIMYSNDVDTMVRKTTLDSWAMLFRRLPKSQKFFLDGLKVAISSQWDREVIKAAARCCPRMAPDLITGQMSTLLRKRLRKSADDLDVLLISMCNRLQHLDNELKKRSIHYKVKGEAEDLAVSTLGIALADGRGSYLRFAVKSLKGFAELNIFPHPQSTSCFGEIFGKLIEKGGDTRRRSLELLKSMQTNTARQGCWIQGLLDSLDISL